MLSAGMIQGIDCPPSSHYFYLLGAIFDKLRDFRCESAVAADDWHSLVQLLKTAFCDLARTAA